MQWRWLGDSHEGRAEFAVHGQGQERGREFSDRSLRKGRGTHVGALLDLLRWLSGPEPCLGAHPSTAALSTAYSSVVRVVQVQ